jgi:hypothetical protein
MIKNKLIVWVFVLIFFNSCQTESELNRESLKINMTLSTSLDVENLDWMVKFFKSVKIDHVNYVSKNNNDKIGININRIDNKEYKSLDLIMHDGNGIKQSMDVYDNSNLQDDIGKINVKDILKKSKLIDYVTTVSNSQIPNNFARDITIDLNKLESTTEKDIQNLIRNKIKKNPNSCTINVLVIKSNLKSQFNPPKIKNIPKEADPQSKVTEKSEKKSESQIVENIANVTPDFYTKRGLQLKYDINSLSWRNFGEVTYKIEFIDYVTGKVCCKIDDYKETKVTAKYLLNNLQCIKYTNRYIVKISTNAHIKGHEEKVSCCSIGFQSGGFAEDCSCDNVCD